MVLYRSPECIGYAELKQAWKYITICYISFHPCRSIRKQIWPCHKNGRGQPSIIIWTNLVVHYYPMLFTKFQDHKPRGSEEGDFRRFLPYLGLETILVMWHRTFEQIFIPASRGGSIRHLASNGFMFFEEKKFENVESEWPWTSQWMTLTFSCHKSSCTYLFDCIYTNCHLTCLKVFLEIYKISIFLFKNKRDQIWSCCKVGQDQLRVII